MQRDLGIYIQSFSLESAELVRIDHADTIIAEVYKVIISPKKQSILKICPRASDYFREVYFLHQLKTIIPIPHLIQTIDPSNHHFGAILMEYLEGDLLKDSDWSCDLAYEIGHSLARLHSIRVEEYGDITNPTSLTHDPKLYFNSKFEEELDECEGHLPSELLKKCSLYLNKHQGLLEQVDGPCMVHRDFRPGNMMVWRGHLQGIIDWSSGRFGFAEQDFCSIEYFTLSTDSNYKKFLLEGYSTTRPIPNYGLIMPLLQLGRSLAVIGYAVKSATWNRRNRDLYQFHRTFLDSFDFFKGDIL